MRLRVDDEILTRVSDFGRKEDREFVRGSAVSLSFWLADNFWRLRHESLPDGQPPSTNWRLRHEMTSAAGGTMWPPIMIHSTGERILFAPAFARALDLGALRFELSGIATVSAQVFEDGLDRFFDGVIETCARAVDGTVLKELVGELRKERADPELAAWRRVEAKLGYDPDTVPNEVMTDLAELEGVVGEAALDEAAAATPGQEAGLHLAKALEATRASEVVVDFGIARRMAVDHGRVSPSIPPWQYGREAAERVRDAAGFGDRPIRAKAFSDLLEVTVDGLRGRGTARRLPYSARLRERGDRQRIALKSSNQSDRRFELSCALADEIWADTDFGIVSKAKTDRQKFQRAFAQNLLVPFSGLEKRIDPISPTESQIEQAAIHYHVHENVIRRLLILEEVLPRETFEQRLEAA